jgi:hypothetical protein
MMNLTNYSIDVEYAALGFMNHQDLYNGTIFVTTILKALFENYIDDIYAYLMKSLTY